MQSNTEWDIESIASYFPRLLWVLRDASSPQLVDEHGRQLTSRSQYITCACVSVRVSYRNGNFEVRIHNIYV